MCDFKICTKCNIEKEIKYFEFRTDTKKYRNYCKNCNKGYLSNREDKSKEIQDLFLKGLKLCGRCKNTKSINDFNNDKQTKTGKTSLCTLCISNKYTKEENRNFTYKYRYGIDIVEYNRLYLNQNGKCDICNIFHKKLVVDHCHKTLKVRGLLCNSCNFGIGFLKDDINIIKNSIDYLIKNK